MGRRYPEWRDGSQTAIYASRFLIGPIHNPTKERTMSQQALKAIIQAPTEVLTQYAKLLNRAIEVTRQIYTIETASGTNTTSMEAIQAVLDHEFKALYKDALANLAAKRKEEDDYVKSFTPKSMLPKNFKKSPELDQGQEVTDPEALLGKIV